MIDLENIQQCLYADNYILIDVVRSFSKKKLILLAGLLFCFSGIFIAFLPLIVILSTVLGGYVFLQLLKSQPQEPKLYGGEFFKNKCLNACPTLRKKYIPPLLWGRSGLLQSVMLMGIGRLSWKMPNWERRKFVAYDETTMYYDILHPSNHGKGLTLIICPGYGCFSHLHFIRHFCLRAQREGIKCVVINQPAFTPDLKLTSPRLYSFYETEFLEPIVKSIAKEDPLSKIVLIGHSYGTGISTKFSGEMDKLPTSVCGLITVGALGSPPDSHTKVKSSNILRTIFSRFFAETGKYYIFKHRDVTLTEQIKQKYNIDENKLRDAQMQVEVIDNYIRKVKGFSSIKEYLQSCNVTDFVRKVAIPFVVFHAEDDPLLPHTINQYKPIIENREDSLLVTTKHGGHLSYYTGGIFLPSEEPWIDDAVLEVAQFMAAKSGPLTD